MLIKPVSRRTALTGIAAAAALPVLASNASTRDGKFGLPPIRTITQGPQHHWFGYYDKREFDPTNRFVLSNEVDFEGRMPRADDVIRIGMIDSQAEDKWIELGTSNAWGWQQGCMLQWRPQTDAEAVWNVRKPASRDERRVSQTLL